MTSTTAHCTHHPVIQLADRAHEPPESLRITAAGLRAFRNLGWTVSERRTAGWLYLIARGHDQSAVYKLIGPRFDHAGSHYQAERVA
jgi:hypothetical protein